MRLILLGCPGAGKGTQAQLISQKYQIPQISTGAILRSAIEQASSLGKQVKKIVESGELVPDEIIIQLVLERIKEADCKKGFLLDGFPRTVAQAQALEKVSPIDCVINIDVPQEEIVKRLSGRRIHPASGRTYHLLYQPPHVSGKDNVTGENLIQRPDDKEETVLHRLSVYQMQTSPLKNYYQLKASSPRYLNINGMGTIEEIKSAIFSELDKLS
jgi:adenylate kinase